MKNLFTFNYPLAYHISYTCYGTKLHGSSSGSVYRSNAQYGTPYLRPDPYWERREMLSMKQPPYLLDPPRRELVYKAIIEVCLYRNWDLIGLHVRSTHIHALVSANTEPEKIMKDFKAYSSRALNNSGFDTKDRRRWTRHGSTEYLWNEREMENVLNYIVHMQGEPMKLYVRE
ncbi:MAG: transposase [bacterium]|nr:transposase [bacterium]